MHVENQSQQVSIRFNPVAPIAPGHCFYFLIFMNQIYQRALLETTSCQYLMQKNLLGAGFVREIQGSADLQRLEMTHRYGYGSKATLLNIQNIGPYWAHMLHHFFNIYHPIPTSIYIYAIYIYSPYPCPRAPILPCLAIRNSCGTGGCCLVFSWSLRVVSGDLRNGLCWNTI